MTKAVAGKSWGLTLRSDGQRYSAPPITPPTAIVRTVDSSTQITLQASGGASGIATTAGYRYRRNGAVLNQTPRTTSYADTGLSAATQYVYSATQVDQNGNESDVSTNFAATTASASDSTAPTAAVIAAQALSASTIRVSLTTPSTDSGTGLRDYTLQWSISSSGPWNDLQTALQSAGFPVTHSGLTASTQRFYRLVAFDVAGNSSNSAVVSATTSASGGAVAFALNMPAGLTIQLDRQWDAADMPSGANGADRTYDEQWFTANGPAPFIGSPSSLSSSTGISDRKSVV